MIGGLAAYLGTDALPYLQKHVSSEGGKLLVALAVTGLPIVVNILRKLLWPTGDFTLKLLIAAMLLPALGGPALADHGGVLIVAKKGYYILEEDATTGVPTIKEITSHFKQVIVLSDSPEPPPPGPSPPNLTQRGVAVRDAAAKATGDPKRAETAAKLATLYKELAAQVKAGTVAGSDVIAFVAKSGADLVIGSANAAAWQPFRDLIGNQFAALNQEGGKDADYIKWLEEVAAGLTASVPASQMQAMDLRALLELIRGIIEMILKLRPQTAWEGGPFRP